MGACHPFGVQRCDVQELTVPIADTAGREAAGRSSVGGAVSAAAAAAATISESRTGVGHGEGVTAGAAAAVAVGSGDGAEDAARELGEPELVHRLVAASITNLDWKGVAEVPEWLNELVRRMWPKMTEAIERLVREEAVEAIREELPTMVSSHIHLARFDLGDQRAPRVEGIRCTETDIGVKVALGFEYSSGVDISVAVGAISVGISELKVSGCVVLELGPLLKELPVVGAIEMYFVDPPQLNYKFTGMALMAEAPLVRSAVRSAIDSVIAGQLVLPNSVVIPLATTDAYMRALIKHPVGVLRVTVQSAKGLSGGDWSMLPGRKGKCDPYVRAKVGNSAWCSSVVRNSRTPRWGEADSYDFVVYDMSQRVCLEVLDRDVVSDDMLGVASPVPVGEAFAASEKPIQLFKGYKYSKGTISIVKGKKKGSLQVNFEWFNIARASPQTDALPGRVLMAELGHLTLPVHLAKSVQVVVCLGARRTRSPYIGRSSPRPGAVAAPEAMNSAIEEVIRKGAQLGVGAEILGQMTGVGAEAVAELLAEGDRERPVKLLVGSCLSLPLSRGVAELTEADVEIQVRDLSKRVLGSFSVRLASPVASPVWPPAGREGEVAELTAHRGGAMTLEVKLFTAGLEPGAPPSA